jgi:subtilisin family serine protease
MRNDMLENFVYAQDAGKGTFIYVIDSGIVPEVKNVSPNCSTVLVWLPLISSQTDGNKEFKNVEVIQTTHSKNDGEDQNEDHSDVSHGTLVASHAAGQKYGVAKEATIIAVKLRKNGRAIYDFIEGLQRIIDNLNKNPNRQPKAIVTCSLGFKMWMTHDLAKSDPDAMVIRPLLEALFEMGVPFISSAGNYARINTVIDRLPKVLEDPYTPIINVGAVDKDGRKITESQDGPQLTISGPGFEVNGQTKDDGIEGTPKGTSHCESTSAVLISSKP